MIKVSVYYNPGKRGQRSHSAKPWCVTAYNGERSETSRWATEEEALAEKARIEEANV